MKKLGFIALCISLIFIARCSKDSNVGSGDLMEGAKEYTGTYPNIDTINFTDNGKSINVQAFVGQYIVFMIQGTSEPDARQFIESKGGTIIAKIPQIGYYLIQNTSSSANNFISDIQTNALVTLISPHMVCYPKSGALVLDHCALDHGIEVQATLTSCNGTDIRCKDITTVNNNMYYASDAAIINGIIGEGNKNKTEPTFINLSFNGGLARQTDYDFNLLSQAEKDEYVNGWYWHMTNVLMCVAALREEYRANLVITIAAGNENCPIAGIMELLRQRPRIADILRDNVLLVSTEKIKGIHANYAYEDPDVIVLNNESASKGSSLAAPCALGYLQNIVQEKGVSAREALKAMKLASWRKTNREVDLNSAMSLVGSTVYSAKGPFTIKSSSGNVTQNMWTTEHVFSEVQIVYQPNSLNPFFSISDCIENWTYQKGILVSHTSQTCGQNYTMIRDSLGILSYDPFPTQQTNVLVFAGTKSTDGSKIVGDFWIDWDPNTKVTVELKKQ